MRMRLSVDAMPQADAPSWPHTEGCFAGAELREQHIWGQRLCAARLSAGGQAYDGSVPPTAMYQWLMATQLYCLHLQLEAIGMCYLYAPPVAPSAHPTALYAHYHLCVSAPSVGCTSGGQVVIWGVSALTSTVYAEYLAQPHSQFHSFTV